MPPRAGGLLHVLVMGGSQGARVLSRYVPRAMASLDQDVRQRLRVVHQAREEDLAEAAGIYEEAGIRVEIAPFFEDIPSRLARAHLVISRAGASSVAEIAAMARPAILIPYAHAMDDHQRANAAALELIGGAVVMPEGQLTREKLASRIQTILTDPDKAEAMSRYAAEAAHPNATADLADLVETLGTGGAR
ncbi:MAG: glycosyltransferase [Pseudomonadota bacterium]